MTTWQADQLEGEVVRLEPLTPSHLDDLWAASRDPEVWRWLSITQPATRDGLGSWIAEAVAGPDLAFATVLRASGAAVGSTWLARDAWGTGANVEAKLLMLSHAFDVWGCRRVELKTDALNDRSRGAIEALGASFEGVHRKHMHVRGGENRDSAWYSVLDDEWPSVRARLLARLQR